MSKHRGQTVTTRISSGQKSIMKRMKETLFPWVIYDASMAAAGMIHGCLLQAKHPQNFIHQQAIRLGYIILSRNAVFNIWIWIGLCYLFPRELYRVVSGFGKVFLPGLAEPDFRVWHSTQGRPIHGNHRTFIVMPHHSTRCVLTPFGFWGIFSPEYSKAPSCVSRVRDGSSIDKKIEKGYHIAEICALLDI